MHCAVFPWHVHTNLIPRTSPNRPTRTTLKVCYTPTFVSNLTTPVFDSLQSLAILGFFHPLHKEGPLRSSLVVTTIEVKPSRFVENLTSEILTFFYVKTTKYGKVTQTPFNNVDSVLYLCDTVFSHPFILSIRNTSNSSNVRHKSLSNSTFLTRRIDSLLSLSMVMTDTLCVVWRT